VRPPNLFQTSAFRLTLLYLALFSVSVLALLGFIYWSTVAVIERQTAETIESEIRGLAEQYRRQGLGRLIEIVRERSDRGDPSNVYLLTDPARRPLVGNLAAWPETETGEESGAWITLNLDRRLDGVRVPRTVRARTFVLTGDYRLLVGRDTQERIRFRRTVVQALAWSLAAMLVLGLAGGALISRGMLARVDRVAGSARAIMAGDLSQRLATGGSGDEFDRLASSLNGMLDRIEALMTGMRLATDSLAHDLRGPLTRLRSRIELALRAEPDSARDREALAAALDEADATLAMFESLLRIALAEGGVAKEDFRALPLDALARDAAELYAPLAEEKGVTLATGLADDLTVSGHGELLAQAVSNLLDNAVKHTPPGGRIDLTTAVEAGAVTLLVADTGPGIPEADRARVQERFVRLDRSRGGPGAGLGLSLVAAVARLHGAALELEDNAPGLRVVLRFPVHPNP